MNSSLSKPLPWGGKSEYPLFMYIGAKFNRQNTFFCETYIFEQSI
jgi:hypothetical protein